MYVIGIDLGNTNSCVAVYKIGDVHFIESYGSFLIPSCVAFTNNGILVGKSAFHQINNNYKNTIINCKRLIGRYFNDDNVQSDIKRLAYNVLECDEKCCFQVELENRTKIFTPEYISSKILSFLKKIAEDYLDEPVGNAVITVPAYFGYTQREATLEAAKMAGLNVLQIINEPTAAALAYGFNNKIENKENILVLDLGGGTYDVSLISIRNGKYKVKAISGDNHLGGEDFTNRLVDHFIKEIKDKYKVDVNTHSESKGILSRLRNACECAKVNLSISNNEEIGIANLFDNTSFVSSITRSRFEELNSDLFERLLIPIEDVIYDSNINKSDINDIVLVGGSIFIPKIQEIISSYFNMNVTDLKKSINPNNAVVYGAAVQAFKLNGKNIKLKDIFVMDIVPFSIGIMNENEMDVIIRKNSSIPIKNTIPYYTRKNYQTSLLIEVYESENNNNRLIEIFTLKEITRAKSGEIQIDVTFEIDINGILRVYANEKGPKCNNAITITNSKGVIIQEKGNGGMCTIL